MDLADFDFSTFWEVSDYATQTYVGAPVTSAMVNAVEQALGYKLPQAYIQPAKFQNGGIPSRRVLRTSPDFIGIGGLLSIGQDSPYSLCGQYSSRFWIETAGYPPIGVYFADGNSGGRDMLCLDYSACGPTGEPSVVHLDEELGYQITPVAENFAAFLRGLEDSSVLDEC